MGTPTVQAPGNPSRADINRRLASEPVLKEVIATIESQDLDGLMTLLLFQPIPCTPVNHRGGPGPWCEPGQTPDNTVYSHFPEEITITRYFDAAKTRRLLEAVLGGKPELAVLAWDAERRQFYASFAIAPSPNPVDTPDKASMYDFVGFGIDPNGEDRPVVWFTRGFNIHTPLDMLRDFNYGIPGRFTGLYISPEMEAREARKHELHTAGDKDPVNVNPPTRKP
jgi:hypothetical protein